MMMALLPFSPIFMLMPFTFLSFSLP